MTDNTNFDENQTPEQVSAQVKEETGATPENPQTPETPAEDTAKVETPAEPKVEPTDPKKPEDKTEDKKPDEPLQTKPRSIYDEFKEKKKEVREKDTEIEILKSQLSEKDQQIADLIQKGKDAETPAEKAEVSDEITALAEEIGADPAGIAKLTEFLKSKVKSDDSGITKEDIELVRNFTKTQSLDQAKAKFNSEWDKFEPALKAEFPHASAEELANIKKEVDLLAHSPRYNTYEVDYIYFKEKGNLSKLISPKRPSYEGGDMKPAPQGGKDVEINEKSSPMDVQRATENVSTSSLEIRPSN